MYWNVRSATAPRVGSPLARGTSARKSARTPSAAGKTARTPPVAARDLTDDEMERLQEMMEGKDLNELYKEQQEREGRSPPSN